MNDGYFDPTFGGKDWQAIGKRYRQRLETVQDDHAFWLDVLNPMLFELGVSHIGALPPEFASQLEPMTFSTGTLGMEVRLLDGQQVISEVAAGFPADTAGLRPGYVITAVDGWTLESIAAYSLQSPPNNDRPVSDAYRGRLVLLVDELSASSAEEFAGSLQAMGRATLIGARTPGRCLVANLVSLPNEAILIYPFGQSRAPNGRVLEGNGVAPDILVELERDQLLQGVDAQLEAAVEYLREQGDSTIESEAPD